MKTTKGFVTLKFDPGTWFEERQFASGHRSSNNRRACQIITLYNVCAVPWGVSVPWRDIMSTVGGYLEYRGGCSVPWRDIMINVGDILSTVGDIMSTVGGYLEYRGGCSVPWGDIMMHVGDIMSIVGDVQYRGGIPSFEI